MGGTEYGLQKCNLSPPEISLCVGSIDSYNLFPRKPNSSCLAASECTMDCPWRAGRARALLDEGGGGAAQARSVWMLGRPTSVGNDLRVVPLLKVSGARCQVSGDKRCQVSGDKRCQVSGVRFQGKNSCQASRGVGGLWASRPVGVGINHLRLNPKA